MNIALDLAKLEKARPADNPLPSSNINQAQEIVPDFLQRQDAVNQMLQNVKLCLSGDYALSRLENSRVTHTMWVSHMRFVKLR